MLSIVVQTVIHTNIIHVSDSSMTLRNKIQYWSFVNEAASLPEFKSQQTQYSS